MAEFRLSVTEEVKRWVLGFGSKAVVLGPDSLRREVAEELQALLAAYQADVTGDRAADAGPDRHVPAERHVRRPAAEPSLIGASRSRESSDADD